MNCPNCDRTLIKPSGLKESPVLLIGEFPGEDEIREGRPFCGRTGTILWKEMGAVGVDIKRCRITNVWLHEEPPKKTKEDKTNYLACLDYMVAQAVKEARDKKAILLIGSDTVKLFTGYPVSDVNGLQVESDLLTCPIIMASVNPAVAFHEGVGEVRFAFRQFSKMVEDLI